MAINRLRSLVSAALDSGLSRSLLGRLSRTRESPWGRCIWRLLPEKVSNSMLSRIPGAVEIQLHFGPAFLCSSFQDDHYLPLVRDGLASWEFNSQSEWVALAKKAKEVVDVGAYLGVYTLLAAATNSHARVIAFEPNPQTFHALDANLKLNQFPNVMLLNSAVGRQKTSTVLQIDAYRPMSSGAQVRSGHEAGFVGVEVDQVRLDDMSISPDLIKIDAEGMELEVLSGATRVLTECRPTMILEVLTQKQFELIVAFLVDFGYCQPRFLGDEPSSSKRLEGFLGPGNYLFTCDSDERLGLFDER